MTMSKTREGEQVFPSLSYEGENMSDPGYASFQDPRLIPPDVDEPEREDKPLTHELRNRLDRLDIDYSCGWRTVGGNHINLDDVTHILIGDGRMVTVVEEVDDTSHLYLDIEEFTSFTPQEIAAMMGALRQ